MIDRIRELLHRLHSFFRRDQLDRELDAEMALHLEMAIEENLRKGMTQEEARRQAALRFGGTEQVKETHREARGLPWLDILKQDLRYTIRTLRRDRGFAAVAILILALGIGANIAVFSMVNTLLLRPLPFPHAEQLVWFTGNHGEGGLSGVTYNVSSYEEYAKHARSFQEVTCYQAFWGSTEYNMTAHGDPKHVQAVMVANNFFHVLGVNPMLGRTFLPAEHAKGAALVAMLTYPFWQREFGGDPGVLGRTVNLDNRAVTIIGVLPRSFDFASVFSPGLRVDFFIPAYMDEIRNWGNTVAIFARLKPGVSLGEAQAEANVLSPQFRAAHPEPDWFVEYTADLSLLQDYVTGTLRHSLFALWGAVGVILLIVCVNLSTLLLARLASRSQEFAMRSALGAGRLRLVGQLLIESLGLSSIGAALGVGIAYGITLYLAHQDSIVMPLLNAVSVDGNALGWTLLITLAVAALFGIVPGMVLSTVKIQDNLKEGGRGVSTGRVNDRVRSVLVVSEIALACVLLVGCGLLLRSFLRVLDVDLGFQPSQASIVDITYESGEKGEKIVPALFQIVEAVKSVPGVEAAGVADMLPLDRERGWGLVNPSREYAKTEDQGAIVRIVTPGYLDAMGIRLIKGRDISWQEMLNKQPVVIINETGARRHWPGQDPIGHDARGFGKDTGRVIGVVGDVRISSMESSPDAEIYLPSFYGPEGAQLVVRSKLPPETLTAAVIPVLRRLNPAQPNNAFRPLQSLVDHSVSPRRFFVWFVSVFAAFGLALAALGIFGVISYSVTRRTHEIGIRMALGASPGQVQWGVITKTLRLALIGVAIGAIASFIVARWIASLLYHTEPTDPAAFAVTVFVLTAVAFLAGYLPSLRASHVEPVVALRHE
ncbi:MAG TPA: ABC transporter permease [Dongiaceae bacterium]|nr:ABC transporter permease [Dongiaceae bacterium]